jgi:hypothetical protein
MYRLENERVHPRQFHPEQVACLVSLIVIFIKNARYIVWCGLATTERRALYITIN